MLVIEHDMPLLRSIADELVVLDNGAVIAGGEPDAVLSHPAVIAAYLGTSEAAINRSG
jgi:ABC-type branched-subunit amino acid transport system ATPase component